MPEQNLNQDAVETAAKRLYDQYGKGAWDALWERLHPRVRAEYCTQVEAIVGSYLSALPAQPDTVNSVGYRSTPQGHYDAWQDTGDGYTQRKGWTLTCIWCGAEFTGDTKSEALKGYSAHEESILQKLREADAELAKDRPTEG